MSNIDIASIGSIIITSDTRVNRGTIKIYGVKSLAERLEEPDITYKLIEASQDSVSIAFDKSIIKLEKTSSYNPVITKVNLSNIDNDVMVKIVTDKGTPIEENISILELSNNLTNGEFKELYIIDADKTALNGKTISITKRKTAEDFNDLKFMLVENTLEIPELEDGYIGYEFKNIPKSTPIKSYSTSVLRFYEKHRNILLITNGILSKIDTVLYVDDNIRIDNSILISDGDKLIVEKDKTFYHSIMLRGLLSVDADKLNESFKNLERVTESVKLEEIANKQLPLYDYKENKIIDYEITVSPTDKTINLSDIYFAYNVSISSDRTVEIEVPVKVNYLNGEYIESISKYIKLEPKPTIFRDSTGIDLRKGLLLTTSIYDHIKSKKSTLDEINPTFTFADFTK